MYKVYSLTFKSYRCHESLRFLDDIALQSGLQHVSEPFLQVLDGVTNEWRQRRPLRIGTEQEISHKQTDERFQQSRRALHLRV